MIRNCFEIDRSSSGHKILYVDTKNAEEIVKYLEQDKRHKKKFRYIKNIIFGDHKITDLYDKENISERTKNVTAMKFFKGQENDRIYCKEYGGNVMRIVMVRLEERKKVQGIDTKIRNIIEAVGGYNYDFK
jgi:phage-related protein